MESQAKTCQNCKSGFVIAPEDFIFYDNVDVSPPTFCWRCRLQRRMASRPIRAMYMVTCGLCNKDVVSVYPAESSFPIYCSNCWHGDKWGALEYGQEYDFDKPFFEQFRDLLFSVPRQATRMRNSNTSKYCDGVIDCDRCYMVVGGYKSQDCMYGEPLLSKYAIDSDLVINADHTYETISSTNVFNTKFVYYSDDTIDSSLMFDSSGCTSCFGCINLRKQSHRIFNEQLTKEEYKEKMKYWDLGSYQRLQEARQKFWNFYLSMPRRYALITNGAHVTGDDITNANNAKYSFVVKGGVKSVKYTYGVGLSLQDSYDVNSGGERSQLLYESAFGVSAENVLFSTGFNTSHDIEYCEQAFGSSHAFGCVGIKHKKYCILNKQYTKQEYEDLREKIIEHMDTMPYVDKKGRTYKYGEYFPIEHSLHPYNESLAFRDFRLTKQQAEEMGYPWREREKRSYVIDVQSEALPDHVRDAENSLAGKVIECLHKAECNELCTGAFRITKDELAFYKQMNVALPRYCPNCRYFQRFAKRNPVNLWHRSCMCEGVNGGTYINQSVHDHGKEKCTNEFETAIASDRKEIVYCQQCYNDEFL